MKKKIAILVAGLTFVAVGCSSSGYEFTPDNSDSKSESEPLTECGVVEYWHNDGWTTTYESVGHVCPDTTTTTEGN